MADLTKLAQDLLSGKELRNEPTAKRIRANFNGHTVLDTINARLVWETPRFPDFWIPEKDFTKAAKLERIKPVDNAKGASHGKLTAGDKSTEDVLLFDSSVQSAFAGLVKLPYKTLDTWFEEMSPVLYHPKSPTHRIDILPSSRHIKVSIGGVVLADTGSEGGVMSLWETNFPGRWYLPPTAVDFSKLSPSDTKTGCPYKGEASYYHANVNGEEVKDAVWWYRYPLAESATIQGLLCFYPDKVDMWIDGVEAEKNKKVNGKA